jgi:hypothetical protein
MQVLARETRETHLLVDIADTLVEPQAGVSLRVK